jgi:D-alanyl-D-alanine endopeptidase (penicillin-binding protein 7)
MVLRFGIVVLGLLYTGFPINLLAGSSPNTRPPRLRSAAALVKDQYTGELLLTKHADAAMPIASITKLMTAMVILDARLDMEQIIIIDKSDNDTLRHSHSRLPFGTRLTRREALQVALMASENRAAHALGRTYPGGISALVKAMNEKARALGLEDTNFNEPTGLSEANVSSARDLSRLAEIACHYPPICAYTTQSKMTIRNGRRKLNFVNTNALVRNSQWEIGLSKTGYIQDSGRCLVMQAQLGGRPILIILLNSDRSDERLDDAKSIKRWLERNRGQSILTPGFRSGKLTALASTAASR